MTMLASTALLAFAVQDPLYDTPRTRMFDWVWGVADFNQDGFDDLYSSRELVLSDGSFGGTRIQFPDFDPGEPAVTDLNGDGVLDLVTTDHPSEGLLAMVFQPATQSFLWQWWDNVVTGDDVVAAGDVDGDGHSDAIAAGWFGDYAVHLGDGSGGTSGYVEGNLGSYAGDLRLGDLDGDGLDDLVFAPTTGGLSVALATGGGALGPAVLQMPTATMIQVKLADLDGDGDLDAAGATADELLLALGDGAGGLSFGALLPLPDAPWSFPRVYVADYGGDGIPDVLAGRRIPNDPGMVLVAHGDGAGGIASVEELHLATPQAAFAPCDADGDGDLDLALQDAAAVTFYVRDGDLQVPALLREAIAQEDYDNMIVGDADGDGDDDILIAEGYFGGGGSSLVLGRNDGTGGAGAFAFEPGPTLSIETSEVALADFAGDGTIDLLAYSFGGSFSLADTIALLPGDGQGGFGPEILLPFHGDGQRTAIADWTGDGLLDLLAPWDALQLYAGQGDYTFAEPVISSIAILPASHRQAAPLDINLDGDLDAVTMLEFLASDSQLRLVHGDGSGGFNQVQSYNLGGAPRAPTPTRWPAATSTWTACRTWCCPTRAGSRASPAVSSPSRGRSTPSTTASTTTTSTTSTWPTSTPTATTTRSSRRARCCWAAPAA